MGDCGGVSFGNHAGTPARSGNGMELLISAIDRERQTIGSAVNTGVLPSSQGEEFIGKSAPSKHFQVPSRSFVKPAQTEEAASSDACSAGASSATAPIATYYTSTSLTQAPVIYPMFPPPLPGQIQPLAAHLSSQMAPIGGASANGMFSLRCIACGSMCNTMLDLHEHIMKEHLSVDTALQQAAASSGFSRAGPERKTSDSIAQKPGSREAGVSSSSSEKPSSDFPIPTPNFAMLTSGAAVTGQTAVSSSPMANTGPRPELDDKLLSQYPSGAQLNSLPFPPTLSSAYGMINPLLGMTYQNLINANGVCSPASMGGLAGFNPYLAYAMPPGNNLLPNRFPYMPPLHPVMMGGRKPDMNGHVDSSSATSETLPRKHSIAAQSTSPKSQDSVTRRPRPEINDAALLAPTSRQAELVRRRLSVPLIGLNNEFRLPHPYGRVGKSSVAPPFKTLVERSESKPLAAARSEAPTRRESVPEKAAPSRLNAKSIEQHISKLISNNEKVLLNPVLERVKPRRVFRRNSLDPASLSSYSSQLAAKGAPVATPLRYPDEAAKFGRKSLSEVPRRLGSARGFAADASPLTSTRGMSSSEYERMIQLTRAPTLASANRPFQMIESIPDYATQYQVREPDHHVNGNRILGKRSLSTSVAPVGVKRARRTTFFECSDCGVRYRKEENYVIHKQMYCKYRKDMTPSQRSRLSPTPRFDMPGKRSPIELVKETPARQSVIIQRTVPEQATVPTSSSGPKPLVHRVTTSEGTYTKIPPPSNLLTPSNLLSNPLRYVHNELSRTRSADDALHRTEKGRNVSDTLLDRVRARSPHPALDRINREVTLDNEASSTRQGDVAAGKVAAATCSVACSIPTSKLPPNKRHMHLLRCSDENRESGMQGSSDSASSKPSEQQDSDQLERAHDEHHHDTGSDRKKIDLVSHTPSRSDEDRTLEQGTSLPFFNELSVPRSNYKLLLHQISLRNMQDIGYMNESCTRSLHVPSEDRCRKVSLERPNFHTTHENPVKHHRSYSTPAVPPLSGLSIPRSPRATDSSNNAHVAGRGAVKRPHSEAPEDFSSCRKSSNLNRPRSAQDDENDLNDNQAKLVRSTLGQTVLEVESSGKEETSSFHDSLRDAPSINRTPVIVPANRSSQGDDINCSEKGIAGERGAMIDGSRRMVSNAPCEPTNSPAAARAKLAKISASDVGRSSTLLFPHSQPTVDARSHVTFCCVLNPQPAYMEIEAAKQSNEKTSMYSQWAVSDPIMLPTDLSISDLLSGWRRSQEGYRRGIFVNTNGSTELISTENKSYEQRKKEVDRRSTSIDLDEGKREVAASPQAIFSADDVAHAAAASWEKGVTVPIVYPSFLRKITPAVFSSCEDQPQRRLSETVCLEGHLAEPAPSRDRSHRERVADPDIRAILGDPPPTDAPESPLTRDRPLVKISSQDAPPSDSDSDSSSCKQTRHTGKVKRRRSRRERSAASPREQKRASSSRSPSPCYSRLAVHHGKTCSSVTDENLRRCALCSIKAGRSDLVPESGGVATCKPCCQDAGKANGLHSAPASESSTKPSNPSTPLTKNSQYLSPPAQRSAYLDKTRASTGSTQHWVSTSSAEQRETPTSNDVVFRYPSPHRNSETELPRNEALSPSPNSLSPCAPADRSSSDTERTPNPARPLDGGPPVVSPSLAEVVSEVMRSAAMQTKRHGKARSRAQHALSQSRALHPLSPGVLTVSSPAEYVLPWAPSQSTKPASSEKPWLTTEGRPRLNATTFPNGREHADKVCNAPLACDIVLTPATPTSPGPEDSEPSFGQVTIFSDSRESSELAHHVSTHVEGRLEHCSRSSAQQSLMANKAPSSSTTLTVNAEPVTSSATAETNSDVDVETADDGSSDGEEDLGVSGRNDRESSACSSVARPYRCDECKVAFRIGGHLAKHLRSKGHAVAMQKKTLNRLKQQQQQKLGNGLTGFVGEISDLSVASSIDVTSKTNGDGKAANGLATKTNASANQILEGMERLARSQVKALFQGNDEYACVPTCDDVFSNDVVDDATGSQDPRPFKCLACKVAFRFQGHLDRHFRSNSHLLAIGHYEHDPGATSSRPSSEAINCEKSAAEIAPPSEASPKPESFQDRDSNAKLPEMLCSVPEPHPSRSSRASEDVTNTNISQSESKPSQEQLPFPNGLLYPHASISATSPWPLAGAVSRENVTGGRQLFMPYRDQSPVKDVTCLAGTTLDCPRGNGQSENGVSLRPSETLAPPVAVPL